MRKNPDRTEIPKVGAIDRLVITALIAGRWFKPVVQPIRIPAHARASRVEAPKATSTERTPQLSDARLKRDVVRVGKLDNSVVLYRFRYLDSGDVYVGVLAQEVLAVVPEAVIIGNDGLMRVDYERLGTRMMTWDEWQKRRERRLRPVTIVDICSS